MHPHWNAANKILNTLLGQGKIAWLAGGCVRDALLGRPFADIDIVTDATPEEIVKYFKKTVPVGINFGVVMVVEDEVSLEVATLRTDGSYKDGRRPENVDWATPEGDAFRRDFTVNALFYDPVKQSVIDYVDGLADLNLKILRAVGEPDRRFAEDQLRLLRAIRFVAQLEFEIEDETWAAIQKMSLDFKGVSFERIYQEWVKILKAKDSSAALVLLYETALGEKIFPELPKDLALSHIRELQELNLKHPASRMLCLFQHLDEKQFLSLLDRLKYPKKESKQLLDEHRFSLEWRKSSNASTKLNFKMAMLFNQCRAEVLTPVLSKMNFKAFTDFYVGLCDETGCLPKALLQGEAAIRQGLKPGPEMGRWLQEIYEFQVMNRIQDPAKLLKAFADKH